MSDSDNENSFLHHVEASDAAAAADHHDMNEDRPFVYPQVCQSDSSGYYAALGVSVRATTREIRQAFLDLSQRYHTDKHVLADPDMQARMSDRFKELQEAYTILMDDRQRAAYDAAGKVGMGYLALIPASEVTRESIIQHVCLLEREARLRRASKMLAASSRCELHYNLTMLKELPRVVRTLCTACATVVSAESSRVEDRGDNDATRVPGAHHRHDNHAEDAQAHSASSHALSTELDSPSLPPPPQEHECKQAEEEHTTGGGQPDMSVSPPALSMSQLNVFEAEVNGEARLVALLPAEMEAQIRRTIAARTHTAALQSGAPSSQETCKESPAVTAARAEVQRCAVLTSRILARAVLPSQMTGEYGFRHVLSPSTGVQFGLRASTHASHRAGGARAATTSFTVGTKLEHQDQITSYAVKLRTTQERVKATVHLSRALSPLWRLESSLELFRSMQPLGKLKMILERALSSSVVLRNTLVMSWCRPGYFKSLLIFAHAGRQALVTLQVGLGVLSFGFQSQNATVWQPPSELGAATSDRRTPQDANHATDEQQQQRQQQQQRRDSTHNSESGDKTSASMLLSSRARVRVSENVSCFCFPLSAASSLRYEIWYRHSALHRMGVGFTTTVPFALFRSSFSSSSAVTTSSPRMVNGVVLLYARGAHSVSIPILLSTSTHLTHAVGWLLLPALAYRLTRTVYTVRARRLDQAYHVRQRLLHVAEVDVAREVARREQGALEPAVLRGRAREEKRGGLVIVHARYGVLAPRYTAATTATGSSSSARYEGIRVGEVWWSRPVLQRIAGAVSRAAHGAVQRAMWCGCGVTNMWRRGGGVACSPSAKDAEKAGGVWGGEGGGRTSTRSRTGASIFDSVLTQTREDSEELDGAERVGTEETDDDGVRAGHASPPCEPGQRTREEGVADEDVPLYMDVTVAVQNLVHDSKLNLPRGTRSRLIGFCDPDPYTPERKQLKIVYRFRHRRHEVVVDDEDEVELPQKSHLVHTE